MSSRLASLIVFIFATHALAVGGSMDSGGGSAAATEFTTLARQAGGLVKRMKAFPVSESQWEEAVRTTHIEFTTESLRDPHGIEVDALNYPKKKLIRVHLERWTRQALFPLSRFKLVIHEYLGILGIDDSDYNWSQTLVEGGIKIFSLVCNYTIDEDVKGYLSWYKVDLDGDGKEDDDKASSVAKVNGGFVHMTVPLLGLATRGQTKEMGVSFSWHGFILKYTAFIPEEKFHKPGSFSEPYFSMTHYDDEGAPKFKKAGYLDCISSIPQ